MSFNMSDTAMSDVSDNFYEYDGDDLFGEDMDTEETLPAKRRSSIAEGKKPAPFTFEDEVKAWMECPHPTCHSPICPIKEPHGAGRYLYHDELGFENKFFGTCNPPPLIWAAFWRVREEKVQGCSKDFDRVVAFIKIHTKTAYRYDHW